MSWSLCISPAIIPERFWETPAACSICYGTLGGDALHFSCAEMEPVAISEVQLAFTNTFFVFPPAFYRCKISASAFVAD